MPTRTDILLNPEELAALSKKNTTCMKVDASTLAPALCVSRAGVSSAAMFGKHRSSYEADSPAAFTVSQYAQLLEKVQTKQGSKTFADRLMAAISSTDEKEAEAVDGEINRRAVRETRAKYLSARLAGQYQVETQGIVGPPPAAPPLLGLVMVPGVSSSLQQNATAGQQQQHASSLKVLELAQQLVQAEEARENAALAQATRRRKQAAGMQGVVTRLDTNHGSSAFQTPSRDQACKVGSKLSNPCKSAAPGPGKYAVRHSCLDRPVSAPLLSPPNYRSEIKALLAQKAEAARDQNKHLHAISSIISRPSSARTAKDAGLRTEISHARSIREAPSHASFASRVTATPRHHSDSCKRQRPSSAPAAGRKVVVGTTAQLPTAFLNAAKIFSDAHYVHPRTPSKPGTCSFKAPSRKDMTHETAGSHLACKYYAEDIYSSQAKPNKLVLPFKSQTPRKAPDATCSTTPALGPGAYYESNNMPATLTGRHVKAGHNGSQGVLDFSKMVAYQDSPAAASTAELCARDIQPQEVQQALEQLFNDVNPSDMVGIETLHCVGDVQHHYNRPGCKPRPMSAIQAGASTVGSHRPIRPASARVISTTSAGPVPNGTQSQEIGLHSQTSEYLNLKQLQQYSSSGFSRPVSGGRFSNTTREQAVQGLRMVADGKVVPPASAPLSKIRPGQASDTMYDEVSYTAQGHHIRQPAWQLPFNRAALSKQWISALALSQL